ncbi:HAMP domain-containing histidine kinase [Actinoallomurus purpureus]|uniref:sensor histidine kinase n=1 Tax=Actinoallomurus purpureus TaxID=478114 RepID=UPI002092EB9B|nr:HAMP domain-containing sensor histidine kinase [Actinoallomurus purpureus]MCO6008613.1 HAMP domain-containing histidine kinase [Actinoallomurus purpureus]
MRARLILILNTLVVCSLLALGVPLATSIVRQHQESLFQDRLDDTTRFAALVVVAPLGASSSDIGAELTRYHEVYGTSAAVVDRQRLAWISTPRYPGNETGDVPAALRQAFAGRHSAETRTIWPWDDRPLVVAAPVRRNGDVVGAVVTVSPTGRMRAAVTRDWALLAAVEAVAVLLFLALAHLLATWVLRPVRALDAVTHTIATGRLDVRVPGATGPPELRRLTTSFNEMVQKVEAAMERQRAFAADASHQLRNPLSAVMLRLEGLALSLPPGSEEEMRDLRQEAQRLTRVLDDLLELALAEEGGATVETIDVAVLVDERVTAWQVVADQRAIDVRRSWEGPVLGAADPTGVGSAFDAVIDNALKFSPEGSAVTVEVAESGHDVEIRVTDEGSGLPPEELARIGDRFWRSPGHQNVDGSGLGLSVARTLLEASGGRLEIAAAEGAGLRVTMAVSAVRV